MRNILILLIFIAIGFARFGLANEPAARYQKAQIEADQLYNEGHYSKAFKQYRNLAKKADVFSQYRVSYMYLMGQGVEEDLPEAFAWAVLAAQNRDEQLRAYRDTVKDLVPVKERRKAQRKADYYFRRWGKIGLADEARKQATTELRNCTGSRLGSRCEEVYAQQMPQFWSINPGSGTGGAAAPREAGIGGSAAGAGAVSTAEAGSGGASRDAEYYQSLRASIAALNQYIEENAGTVELGEFKVLEPEEQEANK